MNTIQISVLMFMMLSIIHIIYGLVGIIIEFIQNI
jgi:hypothetical protein